MDSSRPEPPLKKSAVLICGAAPTPAVSCSQLGRFVLHVTFDNIWRRFWLLQPGGVLLSPSKQRSRRRLNIP